MLSVLSPAAEVVGLVVLPLSEVVEVPVKSVLVVAGLVLWTGGFVFELSLGGVELPASVVDGAVVTAAFSVVTLLALLQPFNKTRSITVHRVMTVSNILVFMRFVI